MSAALVPAYRLVRHMGCAAFLCLRCDRISFAPSNVARHICRYCQVCLDDIPAPGAWRIEDVAHNAETGEGEIPEAITGQEG